ncbi:Tyrosine aminotransferase [Phytophthora megakarya]|uniref:Tyrosine aminotransferase n=1 Tax=Phytophthora megakarya TaxID=4795 RepID=A0A225WAE5_9STRA|nr:Tyrosine aminotransferase [Phytophthora megakarya]
MNTQAGNADIKPKAILGHGDNFYWTGINSEDGRDSRFTTTFEKKFSGDNLAGIPFVNVVGNHDYGGGSFICSKGDENAKCKSADEIVAGLENKFKWQQEYTSPNDDRWVLKDHFYVYSIEDKDSGISVDIFNVDTGDADVHAALQVCCQCFAYSEGDDDSCKGVARGHEFCAGGDTDMYDACFAKFEEWGEDSRKQLAEKVKSSTATWKIVNSHYSPHAHYDEKGMKEWFDILEGSGIHAWVYGHTHGEKHDYSESLGVHFVENGAGGGIQKESASGLTTYAAKYASNVWTYGGDEYGFFSMEVSEEWMKLQYHTADKSWAFGSTMSDTTAGGVQTKHCWYIPADDIAFAMTQSTFNDAACGAATKRQEWNVQPSEFSKLCSNPIRKIVDNIKKPPTSTKSLIPLSLGDPTVFGNLHCPDVLVQAIVRNTRSMQHNGYIHSAGSEAARTAIAQHYGNNRAPLTMDDIVIASGCSGAIEIALLGLLNAGDNVLLPKPGFPLYQALCEAHKIECRFYNLKVDLDHMQSLVDQNTKAIVINNPSNPCGSVFTKPHLEKILALAELNKVPIIADEIYGDMVFGSNVFFPIATLTKTVPVVAVGGLAKQFLIPGWRVGWVMMHDRNNVLNDVRSAYFKLSQNILGASSLIQSAIPDLLTPVPGSAEAQSLVDFKKRYFATLENNAKFTIDALKKISGLEVVVPQGAMYAMVKVNTDILTKIKDDFDLTQKLLDEESVFVLPGQCFGMTNYFRIVFSAPHEILADAYNRLAEFCSRHQ